MEKGFLKADSRNLPRVDVDMVQCYFMNNSDFSGKGQKFIRSTRESYGDNAVGFVQVKRENQLCIVKARITPEHKVREKGYQVEVQVDEKEEVVLICQCYDCAAAHGGCKHAIAFLLWLHRRSEEPSVTSVTCYWKKAKMAINSRSTDVIRARDMCKNKPITISADVNILDKFVATVSQSNCKATLLTYFEEKREALCVHKMCTTITLDTAQHFLQQLAEEMTEERIHAAFNATKEQSEFPLWFQLRYGRITASILYEAAHCQTEGGSLVNKIMGEQSTFVSEAMERGKLLEKKVMEVVKTMKNITVTNAGLMLCKDFPVLGATPDGMTNEYVIEIKCPFSEKSFKTYVVNGEINKKCWTQIQSQMYFLKKKMGLFCVAHPDFDKTNKVDIYHVPYDTKILNTFKQATEFWSQIVFQKLKNIYS